MAIDKVSRRQFIGGAAVAVGAAVLPAITSISTASATPAELFTTATLTPWVPLDPKAAARRGYEVYKGAWTGQSG